MGDSSSSAPGEVRPRPASVSTKRSPRSRGCARPGSAGPFCPLSPLRSLMLSKAAPGRWENAGTLKGPFLQGPSYPPPGRGAAPGNRAPTGSRLPPRRRDRPETGPSYLPPVVDVLSASICWASPACISASSGGAKRRGEVRQGGVLQGGDSAKVCDGIPSVYPLYISFSFKGD